MFGTSEMTLAVAGWAALLGLALALVLGQPVIAGLRRLKAGQVIREEGPQAHLAKAGTPSMGGVIFLLPALVASLVVSGPSLPLAALWALALASAAVGFWDDWLIVKKRHNKGLPPKLKLLGQTLVASGFAAYLALVAHHPTYVQWAGVGVDLGLLYWPFVVFVIVGASNAVNLTDGVDGLASTTGIVALGALAAMLIASGRPGPEGAVALALAGGLAGFLAFNGHPAKVFMGDTGSLGLGAALAGVAIAAKLELALVPVGIVFIAETLSVMLQVAYFKRTGGKRLFKMSPLHHHFELSGWKETQVVTRFALAGLLGALLALVSYR